MSKFLSILQIILYFDQLKSEYKKHMHFGKKMSRNLGCDSKFMDSKLEYFLNYLSFYNVSKTSKQNHG